MAFVLHGQHGHEKGGRRIGQFMLTALFSLFGKTLLTRSLYSRCPTASTDQTMLPTPF